MDCEREIGGAARFKKMHDLSTAKKCMPWGAVYGTFTRSELGIKRYGCLFTCLTTHAVHIEIAHPLDTDSMINALRRLISVRGYAEQIRSDQVSNFIKADKELKEATEEWNEHKINNFCRQKRIEWIFNPPSESHMGGKWEQMIRSVRRI